MLQVGRELLLQPFLPQFHSLPLRFEGRDARPHSRVLHDQPRGAGNTDEDGYAGRKLERGAPAA